MTFELPDAWVAAHRRIQEDTARTKARQLLIYPLRIKEEPMFSRPGVLDEFKWVLRPRKGC